MLHTQLDEPAAAAVQACRKIVDDGCVHVTKIVASGSQDCDLIMGHSPRCGPMRAWPGYHVNNRIQPVAMRSMMQHKPAES
jgi:hypothetical protein